MSRVFVRIHWCWGGVAVPMAYGTGHGPLSVWKIVARLSLLFDFDPIAVVANGGHLRGFYSTGMGLGIQVLIRLGSIFWPSRAKHAKRETPPDFGGGGAHFVQSRLVDHFWVRGKRLTAVLVLRNRIDTTRQPRKYCFNLN